MKGKTGKEKGESVDVLACTGPGRRKNLFFFFSFVVGWH
jgi:hypothetical protein